MHVIMENIQSDVNLPSPNMAESMLSEISEMCSEILPGSKFSELQTITRIEQMRKIGSLVASWWLTEAGSGSVSHVPISSESKGDHVSVTFAQYQRGFFGRDNGIPHRGWSGQETLSYLIVDCDGNGETVAAYVPKSSMRYHIKGGRGVTIDTLNEELYG